MKQLAINIAKGTTIDNLACSPNTIVLAKQSTTSNAKTGEVTTSVRYIEVCKVEKTDGLSVIKSLLRYIVAEFFVCNELDKDFAETKIKQRKLFNQFLGGHTIYRTNSEGKIANAVVSEVPLRQTGLNVKDYHEIVICKPENRKAAIYQHAKAVKAQCAYIRLIIETAEALDAEQAETTAQPAARARTRRPAAASDATAAVVVS